MAEPPEFGDQGTDELDLSMADLELVGAPPMPPSRGGEVALGADARELVESIERELSAKQKPDKLRAARLRYELGRIAEGALADPRRAAEEYKKAIELQPDNVPAIRGARRTQLSMDEHAEAVRLYDLEVRHTKEPRARARLLHEKGRLLEQTMGMGDRTREAYAAALELDPMDISVLEALERCDRHREAWSALSTTYERLANALEADPAHRAAILAERARLLESRLDDPKGAAQLYHSALEVDPSSPGVLASLVRLARGQKMWRELAHALERWIARSSDPSAQATALWQLARVARDGLGDANQAISALERAVALAPHDRAQRRELADLYREAGKHDRLAATLADLAETAETPEKLSIYLELGRIAEDALSDEKQARAWYERALGIDARNPAAISALTALHERSGDAEALARVLGAEAEATVDPVRRADLHARVGAILEERLGRVDDAEEQMRKALGIAPDHEAAFQALTRIYGQRKKWRELAELYERRVDRAPDHAHRIAWLYRVAAVYEDQLDDPKGAAHAYRRILESGGDGPPAKAPREAEAGAILGLVRAAERGEMWEELVRALELAAEEATPEEAVAIGVRIARVLDVHVGDQKAAVGRLVEVVARDPKHLPALRMLRELYEREGRWDDVVDVSERILAAIPREEQIDPLVRMGVLSRSRIGRDDLAAGYFRRALEIDPTHEPAARALIESLRARGDLRALAETLSERLGASGDPQEDAHRAVMLAEAHEELGDAERALEAYQRALDAVPSFRPALDGRARLLAEAGAWPRLAQALHEEAESAKDPAVARDARVREAEVLAHRVCDLKAAIARYERVLADDPSNVRSLVALAELYPRVHDRDGLARVLERQAAAHKHPSARASALRMLARVRSEASDRAGTDQAYQALLEISQDDAEALEALRMGATEQRNPAALMSIEARLAKSLPGDPRAAAHHQARVAELLEASGSLEALEAWRAALALDPDSLSATRGFTRAARRARDASALREAARREAKTTRNVDLAVELLMKAAELRRQTNDLDEAAADLSEALELAPGNPDVASDLERVMTLRNRVGELVERLSRAADRTQGERAAALHVQVAKLHGERRGDLPAAIAAIDRALKASPRHLAALSLLAAFHERAGHWKDAASALMNLALRTNDPRHLVDAHLRLGILAEEKLNDPMRARKSFDEVLQHDPSNKKALGRLARLNQRQGRTDDALVLATRLVESAQTPAERAEALVEVGRIERARKRGPEASAALLEAISIQGPKGSGAETYRALAAEQPEHATWPAYAAVLEKYLEGAEKSGASLTPVYLELARIHEELGDRDRAASVLRAAASKLPRDAALAVAHARVLRLSGAPEPAMRELDRAMLLDVRSPVVWRELSETLRAAGDPGEAAIALTPLRALDSATPEEVLTLRGLPVRPASAPPGLLGDAGFREIQVDGAAQSPAAALMASAAEAFARVYPPDLARYGVGRRDRIAARSEHPLRTVADRVAAILGVAEFDVYLHDAPGQEVRVELGSTPALMMPTWATQLAQPQLVYLLALPLAHISRETHPLLRIPEAEVPAALAAAARTAAPAFGSGIEPELELDNKARLVAKGVSRRDRARLQDSALRYAASAPADARAWARSMHYTCARAALLICDDLAAALDVVQRTTGETLGPDNLASHLARFWVSDPARRFRRAARR